MDVVRAIEVDADLHPSEGPLNRCGDGDVGEARGPSGYHTNDPGVSFATGRLPDRE